MAMKETPGSLRAYFIVVAALLVLLEALPLMAKGLPTIFIVLGAIRLLLCVGYLVAAVRIHHLLLHSPGFIKSVIFANAIYVGVISIVLAQYLPPEKQGQQLVFVFIGLLISWYLWTNTTRLSLEAQAAAAPADAQEINTAPK